jgi:hypothetical protein
MMTRTSRRTLKIQNFCEIKHRPGEGRAIAQAVSRRLPTAAARIRGRFRSCGICGGQSDTAAGFPRVLRCPLTIRILPIDPQSSSSSSSIIWGR